jgi:streptogramin lyase
MRAAFAVVLCFPLVLTGCALNSSDAPTADPGLAIQGSVHGGQQPIVGSHVYLLAASSSGYGTKSQSLLTNVPGSTTLDSSGGPTNGFYYVTSGPGGAFGITGDYSCTPNTQVYIYALGGDPGAGANSAAGLLAVLGNCPSAGNFQTATPYVVVNEVTTIAAAYSFAGFATDATHVASSNTALAKTGIKNAFANAANLNNLSAGTALTVTPAGNGVVPQAAIYTLADILATCINSTGSISGPTNPTACYTLFTSATSNGTSTGAQPTETATAAINIAHYPGSNVAVLSGLVTAQNPFGPTLLAPINDFTIGLQLTSDDLAAPNSIAIDGFGQAWVANNGASSVTEFSPSSAVLSGSTGYTGGGLLLPDTIAIDSLNNVWVTNYYGNNVTELTNSGTPATNSPFSGGGLHTPYGIAIDGFNNVWVTNYQSNSITELNSAGTPLALYNNSTGTGLNMNVPYSIAIDGSENVWIASKNNSAITELTTSGAILAAGYTGGGLDGPYDIAIDGSGNAWIPNYIGIGNNTITELSSSRTPVGSSPFAQAGAYGPQAIAIDGAGNAWVANNSVSSVTEISSAGVTLSPTAGYTGGLIDGPDSIAVDPSGNVWISNNGDNYTVTELIGAATPVVTPLAVGVKNNTLGTKP